MTQRPCIQIVFLGLIVLGFPALAAAQGDAGTAAVALSPLAVVSRWAHILAAIVMLGGSIFLRFVLMPSVTEVYGQEGHQRLRPVLMRRWRRAVHACIALFLVSGFYNYLVVTAPRHAGQPLYHALFGVKLLLALVVFFLASVLVSGRDKPSAIRANPRQWIAIAAGLATAVVLIGGVMKLM